MSNNPKNPVQSKAGIDLIIITAVTFIVLGIIVTFQSDINTFAKNTGIAILLRVLGMGFAQFGVAGLGISLVTLLRKESFWEHGLNRKKILPAVLFSILSYVPILIFRFAAGSIKGYLPFQSVWMTSEVLNSGFPVNVIGMSIIAVCWGFFEGFNYVVIADKINTVWPSNKKWLNWGALICALMCLLIHGMIGVTPKALIEALCIFIIIYGILVSREITGNAWGCIFVFIFMWNAFYS